jgi:hypothetical protein
VTTIALLVPVTSRGRATRTPDDTDLLKTLVPSVLRTATFAPSLRYALYIGYDAGDLYYDNAAQRRSLARAIAEQIGRRPIRVVWHRARGAAHSPCAVWNALFARAFADGADYFFQTGDDVQLVTGGWVDAFIAALTGDPVKSGLGVAGPVDLERADFPILTQAFVSRLHMEIFGTLYPPAFRNWFSDNWLTDVYAPSHAHRITTQHVRNAGGAERYAIDPRGRDLLAREVPLGRARLQGWLTRALRDTRIPQGRSLGRRQRARIYYIPNGFDCHIADALDRMYTTVKPFGSRDVDDYVQHRILAHRTPNASRIMIDEVERMRPDLVYAESAYNIDADALAFVRRVLGIPVTMWYGDPSTPPGEVDRLVRYARVVDWQVVVDRTPLDAAVAQGLDNVEMIPYFGYDHYFYPRRTRQRIDVLFSGKSYRGLEAQYPEATRRRAFVNRLDRRLGERLFVIGEDWDADRLHNWSPRRVPEWEINGLNTASKIVLAYDAAQLPGFTSLRIWNALLSGAFVLTRKFPGIETYFRNHRHLVWFDNDDEGVALIRQYLRDDRARRRIARAGHQLVEQRSWKFSTVARYLVARGRGLERRRFAEIHGGLGPTRQTLAVPAPAPPTSRAGVTLVSFGTPDWSPALDRLVASASRYGADGILRFGTQDLLGTPFHFEHLQLLSAMRGFGYWIWKPYFIREALRRARDGEIVIYADAGSEIIAPLTPLIELARAHTPIVTFALHGHSNREWTKRDAFVALGLDSKRYWDAEMVNAAFHVYRAGPESRGFVDEWLAACVTRRIVTDDANEHGRKNLPGFKGHRYDQALFSLLCEKHGLERFRDPSQWGERYPMPNSPYGTLIHHHRTRR